MEAPFNAGVLAWNMDALRSSASAINGAFPGCPLLACASKEGEQECRRLLPSATVFTPQGMDALLGYGGQRSDSIGHCRNLLQLASICMGPQRPLSMLDDDVHPSAQTRAAFESAFSAYDLVQGSYMGDQGNRIYALAGFFDLLSQGEGAPSFWEKAHSALCGSAAAVAGAEAGQAPALHSLAGGLAGISPALLGRNAFAPTRFRLEDHFFEFSSRFLFPSLSFMGKGVPEQSIPRAMHMRAASSSPNFLVDGYLLDVQSAIVESYFYFRLSGALPKIMGGSHRLVRASGFDPIAAAQETCNDAALEKFKSAAEFYQGKFQDAALSRELSRIALLSVEDFIVPQGELEREWESFEEERQWLALSSIQCRRDGQKILGGL